MLRQQVQAQGELSNLLLAQHTREAEQTRAYAAVVYE
jgi:hypothetical protein